MSDINPRRIGGSDVAAIMGLSTYGTPFDVWARIHEGIQQEPTKKMMAGRRFERAIGEWWADENGIAANSMQWYSTIEHPNREWQRITPDIRRLGTHEIIDIKRSMRPRERHGEPGTDQIADYEMLQVQTYMEALNSLGDDVRIARLVVHDTTRDELVEWIVERDDELGASIVAACEKFWSDHIVDGVPPPLGASRIASEYLAKKHAITELGVRDATIEEDTIANRIRAIQREQKEREREIDALRNELRAAIGDHKGVRGEWGSAIRYDSKASTYTVNRKACQLLTLRFARE